MERGYRCPKTFSERWCEVVKLESLFDRKTDSLPGFARSADSRNQTARNANSKTKIKRFLLLNFDEVFSSPILLWAFALLFCLLDTSFVLTKIFSHRWCSSPNVQFLHSCLWTFDTRCTGHGDTQIFASWLMKGKFVNLQICWVWFTELFMGIFAALKNPYGCVV